MLVSISRQLKLMAALRLLPKCAFVVVSDSVVSAVSGGFYGCTGIIGCAMIEPDFDQRYARSGA